MKKKKMSKPRIAAWIIIIGGIIQCFDTPKLGIACIIMGIIAHYMLDKGYFVE